MGTNAQLSSESGEWYTPPEWIEEVHRLFPEGFFDPCSSEMANMVVGANRWSNDGLNVEDWGPRWFCNPPGSCPRVDGVFTVCGNKKRCSCSLVRKFLKHAFNQKGDGVFLLYSVNSLRAISQLGCKPLQDTSVLAVPPDRIGYLDPQTLICPRKPSFDSAFLFLGSKMRSYAFIKYWAQSECVLYERIR